MASDLRARLAAVPIVDIAISPTTQRQIDAAVAYLASPEAIASLETDPYWPKWASPWWQMLGLYELGFTDRIAKRTVRALVTALDAMPLHTFPIRADEWPPDVDKRRHASCHCALGNVDQMLDACGVDVDRELPWIREWYSRYQMADGGYNCSEDAYLVADECPSSMVGTIAILESLVRRNPSDTADKAAAMLVARELRHGSPTKHNAKERESAKTWTELCFPRFYFYDVLRGARALVQWATKHGRALPLSAITPVLEHLLATAADGVVRVGRVGWDGCTTWTPVDNWTARQPATPSPIALAPGEVSPTLTRHWADLRHDVIALHDAGRIV
ncbi:MAG: hypothetical protein ACKV2T_29595 [Kofleriaceae bacterium]